MPEFDPIDFLESAVPIASNDDVTEMREFLVETLARHGVEATVDAAGNTIASRGEGAPHIVLNTHIDTVSPHVEYSREGGLIHGRGSCDAKGPLAALLSAFLAVEPEQGMVTLAITPDEETLSTGAAALNLDGDAYIVGEPTGLDVCNAAKGRFQGTVALSGVNAHAAEPDSGVNAIAAVEQALAAIRSFDADRDLHPSLGEALLTPTVIEGGTSTNQIPAECRITLDRRSIPPETAEGFREDLEAHLRQAVPDDVGVEFTLTSRESPFLEAFATVEDDQIVQSLANAAERAGEDVGKPGVGNVRPFTAATEASYFAPVPTVVFGPGVLADEDGAVAHAEREYVETDDVRAAADAIEQTLREYIDA